MLIFWFLFTQIQQFFWQIAICSFNNKNRFSLILASIQEGDATSFNWMFLYLSLEESSRKSVRVPIYLIESNTKILSKTLELWPCDRVVVILRSCKNKKVKILLTQMLAMYGNVSGYVASLFLQKLSSVPQISVRLVFHLWYMISVSAVSEWIRLRPKLPTSDWAIKIKCLSGDFSATRKYFSIAYRSHTRVSFTKFQCGSKI